MNKRAVDLSLEELAAMGANAALKGSNDARAAGLAAVGVAEVRQDGCVAPALVQRHPSGIVTLLDSDRAGNPAGVSDTDVSAIAKRADD
jgi:hypothetical protein